MRKLRGSGLSTGQAATYCLVSSATIVNWIKAERIAAQRTAGGQYRIHRADLRKFMIESGMRTDDLDRDMRPYCWEAVGNDSRPPCDSCPIHTTCYPDCFTSRKRDDTHPRCVATCDECKYYGAWAKIAG